MLTAILDGKSIAYSESTEFLVEIGKGKGKYSIRYRFVGNLSQAVFYYNAINIGNGYKKRLRAPDLTGGKGPVLARYFSF